MVCPKCGMLISEVEKDLTPEGKCSNCGELVMTPKQLKELPKGSSDTKASKDSKPKGGNVSKELSLAACVDIQTPKNKKEAKELNRKLVQIKEDIDASYFVMGTILQVFYDEETFKLLGHETFREYVDNMLGFGWRKAMYLIGIAKAFGEKGLTLSEKQKAGIEWSKMRELATLFEKGILNQENLNEWLELAKSLGTRELVDKIKEAKGTTLKDDGMVSFTIKIFPDQVGVIEQAFEEAGRLADSEAKSRQIEMICAEFLGGIQEPTARLDKLIESIERVYKVKINYEPAKGTEPAKKGTKPYEFRAGPVSQEVLPSQPTPEKSKAKKKYKLGEGKNNPAPGQVNPDKNSKKEPGKSKDKGDDLPYK